MRSRDGSILFLFIFLNQVTVAVLSCTAAVINCFISDAGSESPAVRKFAVPSCASLEKGQHWDESHFLEPAAMFGELPPCWSTLITNPYNELTVLLHTCIRKHTVGAKQHLQSPRRHRAALTNQVCLASRCFAP